ncbi:MAG: hypothetical protein EOO52_04915 [Gammaproteobacteria bacterium]|nr:MAG: hypothetical protein EOO52_04915 [Gammaproteobacteria bacterium]
MRIKQFLFPVALIIPILLALVLMKPSSPTQTTAEQTAEDIHRPVVALSPTESILKNSPQVVENNFDPALALTLLSEVALDENGGPIVNSQLRRQLDNAVQLMGRDQNPAELDKLGELITQAFKADTAKIINQILFQYYAYKIAEEDYTKTVYLGGSGDPSQNIKNLNSLRESYLGHELTEKLFGEENIYQNYIAELTERLSSPDLSEAIRANITAEVRKKYYPNDPDTSGL